MKIKFSKTAITLVELIIGTMLMTIILLGMFAINNVFNNNNQDYGQRYLVKSQTQTTLDQILNNASLAVGADAVKDNEGILIGTNPYGQGDDPGGIGDPNSFCFHQGGTANGFINIANSAADIWLCYTYYPAGTAVTATTGPNSIYYCAETYDVGAADPRGASSCGAAATAHTLIAGSNITFLGTAFSISELNSVATPPTFDTTGGFSITIQNCLDDSLASCNISGTSTALATNPEVQLSGSIFPPQVSTN